MNKNGNITSYIILAILIIITGIFYLISVTVKNTYMVKESVINPTSLPVSSPIFYQSPLSSQIPKPTANSAADCKTQGCSGQYCVPIDGEPVISTCEYKQEYACLKYSVCEIQPDGNCGFTQTSKYISCLDNVQNQQIGF